MKEKEKDIILIKNILEGDCKAQKEFYDKYREILNDYIGSKFPNNYDMEDDVSEILIKIFTNLYKYNSGIASPKTWIFSIAQNHMIDKSRNHIPLTGTITVEYNDSISITNWDCEINPTTTNNLTINQDDKAFYTSSSELTDFENCDTLNFVCNQLTSCDFSFLDMKYNQGFNYNEIGKEFNLTSNTVSNRVNYLKGKLKSSMKEEFE